MALVFLQNFESQIKFEQNLIFFNCISVSPERKSVLVCPRTAVCMDLTSILHQFIQINVNPCAAQADLAFYVELN